MKSISLMVSWQQTKKPHSLFQDACCLVFVFLKITPSSFFWAAKVFSVPLKFFHSLCSLLFSLAWEWESAWVASCFWPKTTSCASKAIYTHEIWIGTFRKKVIQSNISWSSCFGDTLKLAILKNLYKVALSISTFVVRFGMSNWIARIIDFNQKQENIIQ